MDLIKSQNPAQLYLDEKTVEILQMIYSVILPFHKCAKQFLETQKKEALQNPFYDDRQTQGESYEKIFLSPKSSRSISTSDRVRSEWDKVYV